MGREIQLNAPGCDHRVPPRRTEGPIRLKCEGGGVEPTVRISYAPGEDRVLACRIRPVVANACVGLVLVVDDSRGEPVWMLKMDPSCQPPMMESAMPALLRNLRPLPIGRS